MRLHWFFSLASAAVLAGCDIARSECVRHGLALVEVGRCGGGRTNGWCSYYVPHQEVRNVCVERRCKEPYTHGSGVVNPRPSERRIAPSACLTKEEADRRG